MRCCWPGLLACWLASLVERCLSLEAQLPALRTRCSLAGPIADPAFSLHCSLLRSATWTITDTTKGFYWITSHAGQQLGCSDQHKLYLSGNKVRLDPLIALSFAAWPLRWFC